MNCRDFRCKVDDLLDRELSPRETLVLEEHVRSCRDCARIHHELETVKSILATPVYIPEISQQRLWRRLRVSLNQGWRVRLFEVWKSLLASCRQLDGTVLWSKLSAIPLTVGGFVLLMSQFTQLPMREWTYPVFLTSQPSSSGVLSRPLMVQVRQTDNQISELMDTAWRIPYEDSLSLVAEIQPGGYAEIGDILEYPKSPKLLDAVGLSLRNSRFEVAGLPSSFVIYSFQKVDVYEARGL
ncbi:MAG: anti-sigma factor family protein [Acidobacteriota bacterium]